MTNPAESFRQETRQWLIDNCPASMREPATSGQLYYGGSHGEFVHPDAEIWLQRMIQKGWTVPEWPTIYGGGGLSPEESKTLKQEMDKLHCRPPLTGHGIWMLGPALLEFGNEAQKSQHLPKIARGEVRWCQGYSEPGAGSDLASLRCKAEDKGHHYLINGSKTWTTHAHMADWLFCLVRTDFEVKKQAGISFVLIDMQSPGISVKPIVLISGHSDFCETFLDNVKVPKENLVGDLNAGWTIAKKLLVHERTMMSTLQNNIPKATYTLHDLAEQYFQQAGNSKESVLLRDKVTRIDMDNHAMELTQKRIFQENKAGQPSMATFILKYAGTEVHMRKDEVMMDLLGAQALGWEGQGFEDHELQAGRDFLQSKGIAIGGGTSEIQLNIIAKNVLGLPDK